MAFCAHGFDVERPAGKRGGRLVWANPWPVSGWGALLPRLVPAAYLMWIDRPMASRGQGWPAMWALGQSAPRVLPVPGLSRRCLWRQAEADRARWSASTA